MTYSAKIIEDSISPGSVRLTTFQLTYPRYIHAELMTHRVFSRNASSSRAIPTAKLVENSLRDMVYPIAWGLNQAGMQSQIQELSAEDKIRAEHIWHQMALFCAQGVRDLADLGPVNPATGKPFGLHKQWANRPLEWFGNITVVLTSTEWENWYNLRNHELAQPEIHHLAELMLAAQDSSIPYYCEDDVWHLPYITDEERCEHAWNTKLLLKMSVARCARVSYLTQDGKVPSIEKDIELYERLVGSQPIHASPTEHQARPGSDDCAYSGNFRGWIQHRKLIEETFKN